MFIGPKDSKYIDNKPKNGLLLLPIFLARRLLARIIQCAAFSRRTLHGEEPTARFPPPTESFLRLVRPLSGQWIPSSLPMTGLGGVADGRAFTALRSSSCRLVQAHALGVGGADGAGAGDRRRTCLREDEAGRGEGQPTADALAVSVAQRAGSGLWPQPLSSSLMGSPEFLPSLGDARPNFEVPKLGIPRIHPPPGMG